MKTNKSAISSNVPILDDIERAWDSGAAIKRIKEYASDQDGNIDFTKYKKAFFWVNPEEADKQGGYKLPFADVVDGELKAIWRGVAAAMGVVLGARGGVAIPDSENKFVYNAIAKYYKKFDKEVPEFKSVERERIEEDEENPSQDISDDQETEENKKNEQNQDDNEESEKLFIKANYNYKEKIAVASTDVEDRHGERINQEGWKLTNYKNNNVLLWAHDHTEISVGNAKNIHIERASGSPRLVFTPDFHEATDKARALKYLYETGRLNSFSVGFQPIDYDGATSTYNKQELLEISAVNVPANPEARMLAYKSLVGKGIKKQVAKQVSGLDHIPAKKFIEQFKKVRGALQDEIDLEAAREQKHMKMKELHEVFWAFCDVYYDEETAVEDFEPLLKELVGILTKISDGTYTPPDMPNDSEPMEPMDESKVLDKHTNKSDDENNKVKAPDNKETTAAPKAHSTKKLRAQQSLVKTIAKASDKLLEGEKRGIGQNERVDYTKVIKRAAEILSSSHKREINGKNS